MKVFIASSGADAVNNEYKNLASSVSTLLVKHGYKLVFGGLDTGMMGKCLMTYKYEGGKVKAIVEVHDADAIDMLEVNAYEVKPTTFERSKGLWDSSDLVLILPGGIGTYAELFSMMDEKRQKNLDKDIILFNYNDFYTPLLKFLGDKYHDNFIRKEDLKLINIVSNIEDLEKYILLKEKEED